MPREYNRFKEPVIQAHIWITKSLWAKVQSLARRDDRTVSSLIRKAITEFLEREGSKK